MSVDAPVFDSGADLSIDFGSYLDAGSFDMGDAGVPVVAKWQTNPAGKFLEGSPTTEKCRSGVESQRAVTLTNKFEIQTTEVTQAQFRSAMGYNPSHFRGCGNNCPVESVNWHEAAAYCNALSKRAGKSSCYTCSGSGKKVTCVDSAAYKGKSIYACPGYRLPTEAEWEYAYRAGTKTAYYSGNSASGTPCVGCYKDPVVDKIGWFIANSRVSYPGCYKPGSCLPCRGPRPVGQKQPNAFKLYDMAGNLTEWCHDIDGGIGSTAVTDPWGSSKGSFRVMKGGGFNDDARLLRAARRNALPSDARFHNVGLRCVRTVKP
jgi:formylglycine-generating enzyme required for sulfatase activity